MSSQPRKIAVVALGGHAFIQYNQKGTISEQENNAKHTCSQLIPLIEQGYELVITHGNGPQVGAILHQNEISKNSIPAMPLDVCVAQSQGSIGYILQQALLNELRRKDIEKYVVTMITQVIVKQDDPAFKKNRAQIVNLCCGLVDGNSSRRVVDLISSLIPKLQNKN